ncbi:uncharacterized protein ACIBXB_003011 isoform 1-T6 [Morphnus guianensis]
MGVRLSWFGGHCMGFGDWESDVGEMHWIEERCFCFFQRVAEKTQKTEAEGAAEHCYGEGMAPGLQLGEDSAGGGSVHPGSDEDVGSPLCSTCCGQTQVFTLLETTLDLQKLLQETK